MRLREYVMAVALVSGLTTLSDIAQAQIAFRAAASAGVGSSSTITHIGAGNGVSSSGCPSSIVLPVPAGANGDLLIALVSTKDSATLTPSAGWNTLFQQNPVTAFKAAIYWRIATGADGLTVTKTGTGCDVNHGRMGRFRGVDPSNPFESGSPVPAGNWSYTNADTVTTGTETPISPNSMLLFAALIGDNRKTDAKGLGFTESFDSGTGTGTDVQVVLNYQLLTAAGTYGPYTIKKGGGNDPNYGVLFALRPIGSTLTINVPAGTTTNDVMIAGITPRPCASSSGAACTLTVVAPLGWNLVQGIDQTTGAGTGGYGNRLLVYQKAVTGPEPASYTWKFGGSPVHAGLAGGIMTFSGVDNTNPVVANAGQVTPSANSHAAPTISTGTVINTMLVSVHSANSSATWSPPPGMTEAVDQASLTRPDDLGLAIEMNYEPRAAAGTTGSRTATWTGAPANDTGATEMLALRPANAVNHYAISGSVTGVTCDVSTVQFTAHDSAHTPIAPGAGTTLTLSTSTGTGVWQAGLLSGTGGWTPSGANNGSATYVWPGGEWSFSVNLRHNTAATVNINVLDANAKAEIPAEDLSITFRRYGISRDGRWHVSRNHRHPDRGQDVQCRGSAPQTLYLQAIRTDSSTGSCVGLIQSKTVTIEMAGARINPTGSASQPSVLNSSSAWVPLGTGAGAAGTYTNVTLAFDAQSKAPLVISYPNAGSVALYARYQLPSPPASTYVAGTLNTFVVRPFGLRLGGPPSGRTGPGSTVYARAGQNWPDAMTVTAVVWEAGDDTDNDGIPDSDAVLAGNAATSNFGLESTPATVAVIHTLAEPSGGNVGTLSAPLGAFAGGTASATASWSEVGLINLFASSSNYLGGGQNVRNSTAGFTGVGRFTPFDFAVTRNTPAFSPACSANFTYVGQRFNYSTAPVLTVTARNSAGVTTQNYAGTFMKITNTDVTPNTTAARYSRFDALGGGSTPALDVASLPAAAVDPTIGAFSNGVGTLTFSGGAAGAKFTRGLQTLPFNADISLSVSVADSDGIVVARIDGVAAVNPVSFGAATSGNGIPFGGGATPKQMRFGRLALGNAFGSERLDLPIPIETQYYNSSGVYVTNAEDSCTAIAVNNVNLSSGTATGGGTFASGKGNLKVNKPLSKVSIDLCVDLDGSSPTDNTCIASVPANMNYLQWKWTGASFDRDPKAKATFGIFKNSDEFIYLRENF